MLAPKLQAITNTPPSPRPFVDYPSFRCASHRRWCRCGQAAPSRSQWISTRNHPGCSLPTDRPIINSRDADIAGTDKCAPNALTSIGAMPSVTFVQNNPIACADGVMPVVKGACKR